MDKPSDCEERIASLDAARGLIAVSVIVLHSAAGYLKYAVPAWPRYGSQYHIFFDYLACALQMFQMPVFFLLAGFFTFHLHKKLGYWSFIVNRLRRIAAPFFILFILINIPVILEQILTHQINSITGILLSFKNLSFLWFLEYLLIYYSVFVITSLLLKNNTKTKLLIHRAVQNFWIASSWKWLPIVLTHFALLYLCNSWYTPISLSVIPNIWLVCIYGIYFTYGFLLAWQGSLKQVFSFNWQRIGMGMVVYYIYTVIVLNTSHVEMTRIFAILFYALATYLLLGSFFSICVKFLAKPNRLLRLLSEASYWIYLSQIFFILLAHHFIARIFDSIFIQFGLLCAITLILSLLSYKLFFPSSFIRNSVKNRGNI